MSICAPDGAADARQKLRACKQASCCMRAARCCLCRVGPARRLQHFETVGSQAAKDALEDHSKLLLRRFEQLERDAASLQDGNDTLTQQVHALVGMSRASERNCAATITTAAPLPQCCGARHSGRIST